MADFLNIKTIDSETENDGIVDESDNEENYLTKSKKKRKMKSSTKNDFSTDFTFDFGKCAETPSWSINAFVTKSAKGQNSSEVIEEHIRKKRQERKANEESSMKSLLANNDDNDSELEEEISESECSREEYGDDENDKEFFSQPPPQVKHVSFSQMNLSRPLLKAVNDLGFEHPTKIQSSTIPVALLGKDVCACATTGSGKTAAFMLPILERLLFKPKQVAVVRVLVLIPTRELAIQVHSVSQALAKYSSIQICLAAGGLDSKAQEVILRKNPDVVIATPGRLIDHLHNTPSFDLRTIEILVLDEADRMLEEHFQDQMTEIVRLCSRGRQTMLFSATMTDEVEALASLSLNRPVKLFVDQNTDVAHSLHQEFVRIRAAREADRLAVVTALCCRSFRDHTLVFLQTKVLAHRLRIILGLFGLRVGELHGNLTQLQRLESLEKFKNNEIDILVATDLAARGLDISAVKTVISFNMPTTIKSYIHRVGRTARAGKSGRSITLVGEKERKMLKEVVKNAKVPVKNRIVPSDVIDKYKLKVDSFEKAIKDILKQEETDKMFRIAEMEMNKARNLVVHRDEIMSRPAKTFIKQKQTVNALIGATKSQKPGKDRKKIINDEEHKCQKEQMFQVRQMKKERKTKRRRACDENNHTPGPKKGAKESRLVPSKRSFDKELTDTSRKSLKSLRATPVNKKAKSVSGFKSKRRYKRK